VKHIQNLAPVWGEEPEIRLEFVKKVGGLDQTEDHLIFYLPSGIVEDSQRNRYNMDQGNFRIVKFDRDWNFIKVIGREGQGPGEFEKGAEGLGIDENDVIYSLNTLSRRVQYLSTDGEYIGGYNQLKTSVFTKDYSVLSDGSIAASMMIFPFAQNAPEETQVKIFDREGNVIRKFGEIEIADKPVNTIINNLVYVSNGTDNSIVTTHQHDNKISKFLFDGSTAWIADRPLNYGINHTQERQIEPSIGIVTDSKNRIWVLTFIKQPESNKGMQETLKDHDIICFEIFDEAGVLLGSLPTPTHVAAIEIFGDRLYILDTYTEMCVYEYKIVELEN
jgi:hypothetical protein